MRCFAPGVPTINFDRLRATNWPLNLPNGVPETTGVQPSEGKTPVLSGAPFGKFNGQLVARRRSKLMVGTPGAKQRILVDHEAEAQRLGQSNLLKVGLPLSRMGKVQLWTADPYRRDDEFRG